ncbi:hypothetical protein SCHPADRAFT_941639 [Schizopora paradoxa]|uniref:DUF6532 domain-containing protein n=1 Tax=Schizopora paradoxa TaxID=27342 RepID=A0A0H2RIX0_9AGAM|nr:hypothetical protein SCHPADRAFT_941639 [Schizopora paradoxa]
MAGRNNTAAKAQKNAQSASKASSQGNSQAAARTSQAGGTTTTTSRSSRPVQKSDRLLQQEEEQREREAARLLKQQKAQNRDASIKRRAQEREDDASGDYLRGPPPVPRKKPNTSRPRQDSMEADDDGGREAASRLAPRQAGVPPPPNTNPIAPPATKTARFRSPQAQNLFDNDDDVDHASRSRPATNDEDMDYDRDTLEYEPGDADPPATTDDEVTSGGFTSGPDDVDSDDDRPGAISRVVSSSKSGATKSDDGDDGGDDNELVPIEGGPSKGRRPRNIDLDEEIRAYIESGEKHYRVLIATLDAFPSHRKVSEFVAMAMQAVCDLYKVSVRIDDTIQRLLKQRGAQLRGEVKTKARPIVALLYGIHAASKQRGGKKAVRELVYSLLDGHTFIFEDGEAQQGAFLNDTIQLTINEVWFHNGSADGVFFREEFCKPENGISPHLIALVCAVIECCLHEWRTGERTSIKFSTERYCETYRTYVALLGKIGERNDGEGLRRLGRRIAKRAQKHAGISADGTVEIALDRDAIDSAADELGNLSEGDDDDDDDE